MSDTTSSPVVVASPGAPAKKAGKVKAATKKATTDGAKAKPTHPPTGDMVNAAIAALKERGGSSLQAIKKYIAGTFKIDVDKHAIYIKKYLKTAVEKGTLVQTKGSGAAGSFKLAGKSGGDSTKKSSPKKKTAAVKKPAVEKKPTAKKAAASTAVKKSPVAKKAVAAKKVEKNPKVVKPKSPSKAKKSTKTPAAKPKAPKPKKAASPKRAKAAAKK